MVVLACCIIIYVTVLDIVLIVLSPSDDHARPRQAHVPAQHLRARSRASCTHDEALYVNVRHVELRRITIWVDLCVHIQSPYIVYASLLLYHTLGDTKRYARGMQGVCKVYVSLTKGT